MNIRLAVVHLTVEQLELDYGLHFLADVDDLGHLRWVPFVVPSGVTFAFVKYDAAQGGVELWGVAGDELDELSVAMRVPKSMIERTGGPE